MLVVISYDVNTEDAAGRRRLRQVAKQCVNYGQRVQNSVFECLLDSAECRRLQSTLCELINPEKDSLRFYFLGNNYEKKIKRSIWWKARISAGRYLDDIAKWKCTYFSVRFAFEKVIVFDVLNIYASFEVNA